MYERGAEYEVMEYSGDGDVTGLIVPTKDVVIPPSPTPGSTSGCEDADFPAETAGNVALIQRGTCTFGEKVQNAEEAGAAAAIIFNEGQEGRTGVINGTLGAPPASRHLTPPSPSARSSTISPARAARPFTSPPRPSPRIATPLT